MIIIKDVPGQLGNRLWAFTPFINYAIKNNERILILNFKIYSEYFENLKLKKVHFVNNRYLLKMFFICISLLNRIPESFLNRLHIFLRTKKCVSKFNLKKNIVFVDSWHHSKPKLAIEHRVITNLLLPKNKYCNRVDDFLNKITINEDIVKIGVHLRRGDYKNYRNGIYYYSDKDYHHIMKYITSLLSEKKVVFVLCSNEEIDLTFYNDLNIVRLENANLIEDNYLLSKCDYIIGPPSTYSMWASFFGKVPLFFLKNKNTNFNLNNFSHIISQNVFYNGNIFTH